MNVISSVTPFKNDSNYFRITPVYAFVIFFASTWLIRMGEGPFWKNYAEIEYTFCRRNGWTNLLFINNFMSYDQPCMLHGWFLAADFHFVVIAAVLFAIILKYPNASLYLYVGIFVYSFIAVFMINYNYDLLVGVPMPPEYVRHIAIESKEFIHIHIQTHTNVASFVVGLSYGYLYHRLDKAGINLKENQVKSNLNLPLVTDDD